MPTSTQMPMSTPRAIRLISVPVDMVFFIVQIAWEGVISRLSNKPARVCQKRLGEFFAREKTGFINHENGVLQNGTSRFDLTGEIDSKLRFRCCKTTSSVTPRRAAEERKTMNLGRNTGG
jgi:hypothetical protein